MNRKFRCVVSARREVYDSEREAGLPLIESAFPYLGRKFKGYRQALRVTEGYLGSRLGAAWGCGTCWEQVILEARK